MTLILFVYGACLGSWLTATADRLISGVSLLYPPSHCTTCQTPLSAWQLIPIASFLTLRGRCADCATPIPPATFLMEVSCGLILTTLTPTTFWPLLWLGIWSLAALCDVQIQHFPSWLSYSSLFPLLWHHSWWHALVIILLYCSLHIVWTYWPQPTIGDGDLEMIFGFILLNGITATAQWLLVACSLTLLLNPPRTRIAFLPYLVVSAAVWHLWSI